MSDTPSLQGGCQCQSVRYQLSGEPAIRALCHCTMCRRAHAAPAVAWAMYEASQVTFTHDTPAAYASSPGATRHFCARCGTQIGFTADYLPGMIDIAVGSLDEPAQLAPTLHFWTSERLPWLQVSDALPQFPAFPPPPQGHAG